MEFAAIVTLLDGSDGVKARPRHPEKARLPDTPVLPKPAWIRVRAPGAQAFDATREVLRAHRLATVCEEAACPNIGECWGKRHATFMLMGDTCTRACAFCNVRTGQARRARCGRAGPRGERRRRARPRPCGGDLGRPRRSR